jgi:holo-[acyl-carrier protein] synthase
MILGFGSDIVRMDRIKGSIDRFGDKFINRIYSEAEKERALEISNLDQRLGFYAKRFAAKEALSKALGYGIRRGVQFKDVSVLNDQFGKPFVRLEGKAIEAIAELDPEAVAHVTLSDDHPFALAVVIISKS